ncbi:MAG: hypothetical protein ABI881_06445 [Betaproteobacteria bacterium]
MLACFASPASADWTLDAAADITYDSNLSRAAEADVIHGDSAATTTVAAHSFAAPNAFDGVSWGVEGGFQRYARYRGLDNQWLGTNATWRHKFAVGLTAPWILVAADAQFRDYDDELRSGPRIDARLETGRRFNETFSARTGLTYDARHSNHGEPAYPPVSGQVFNIHGRGAYVAVDYAVMPNLLVGAMGSVRRGDVVATASEDSHVYVGVTAVVYDATFGHGLYAYRLRGTTQTALLTASWALDDHSSLDLGYTRQVTRAVGGLDYRGNAASLAFIYRY